MFTGLISGVGTLRSATRLGDGADARFTIELPNTPEWRRPIALGASTKADWFAVEVSAESLALTSLGAWRPGTRINLEGSLRLGDELGGHLVSGHVDGLARVVSATPENGSTRWTFEVPAALARFIAPKGSVALNGVSLTVNEVAGETFGVNIIPHTTTHTNFSTLAPGDAVNVEIDMLARYVARQLAFQTS
jgi:riboflavin synthase